MESIFKHKTTEAEAALQLMDKYPTPQETANITKSTFANATDLQTVSSRGASVFSEVDHKINKMWKVHNERQIQALGVKQGQVRQKKSKDQKEEEIAEAKRDIAKECQRKLTLKATGTYLLDNDTRKWLVNTGRGDVLDFTDAQVRELKACFDNLDEDGGGCIGVTELKGPLISLGFARDIAEVEQLVREVDLDGSGEIEFPEFLHIVKSKPQDGQQSSAGEMTEFFKKLTTGEIGSKDLSFSMFVATQKRHDMMAALTKERGSLIQRRGTQILNNVKLQLATEKAIAFENQFSPNVKSMDPHLRATNLTRIGKQIIDQEMGKWKLKKRTKRFSDFSPRRARNMSSLRASPSFGGGLQ